MSILNWWDGLNIYIKRRILVVFFVLAVGLCSFLLIHNWNDIQWDHNPQTGITAEECLGEATL